MSQLDRPKISKEKLIKAAPTTAVIAMAVLLSCLAVAFWFYSGPRYNYSVQNHFISELGHSIYSPLYVVFSTGVCIAGLFTSLLVVALAHYLDSRISRIAMVVGVISGLACFAVGLLPGNLYKIPHLVAALIFFFGSLVMVALFAIAIYLDPSRKMSKWYILPSIFMVANSTIFLGLPKDSVRQFLKNRETFDRPDWWMVPFFEWMVLFSFVFWILLIARHLWIRQRVEKRMLLAEATE